MPMIRPAALALLALPLGAAAARADAPTPCGPRLTAIYSSVPQANWTYLYVVELVAHQRMEVRVTMELPRTSPRWPNGAAITLQPGLHQRFSLALGVLHRYDVSEMQAHTTLMCRDLG
ncbi:hypothetical protein KTR66_01920 [Roseococcus sp. SDR]|uniref:hypothetical protein n=1 Tax=Roseococcus sp. SDR TaxID=2835532 RepID=UPI001BCBF530|nr:hypothetical protein [Roseococcus sp. SDR]MBS7788731.1 hypothetical protein [Roseococcus sp. SDR]MBV1844045.1 hypothetical protein [Roseococcus sp. SDR]